MDSPFEVLGLDPDADDEAIVRAYRERVKEAHPDHGGTKREFQRVRNAYEQLRTNYGEDDASDRSAARPSAADRGGPRAQPDDPDQRIESRVEYLNYAVVDDHGWELTDDDLFEKAADAGLDPADHGRFRVRPHESLLEAAESRGFAWPFACRGGACTNCAVMVVEGDMPTPSWQILPPELVDRGIRLSCNSAPTTSAAKIVYNVKHLPGVDELRLPASRFKKAQSDD